MKKLTLYLAIGLIGLSPITAETGGDYLSPVLFVGAFTAAYEIPHQLDADPWVSWAACSLVAVADYKISLEMFPSEMEGEWNTSAQLTTALIGSCIVSGIAAELLPKAFHEKRLDFLVEFVVGLAVYSFVHYEHRGIGPWE